MAKEITDCGGIQPTATIKKARVYTPRKKKPNTNKKK